MCARACVCHSECVSVAEASIPLWDNHAFPPLFQIPHPLFPKNFQKPWKIFPISPFSQQIFQILWFSSANISDDLFSHWLKISNLPLLWENYYFPLLFNFPLISENLCFFTYFTCFLPLVWPWCIYASRNACTGRLWSVVQVCVGVCVSVCARACVCVDFWNGHDLRRSQRGCPNQTHSSAGTFCLIFWWKFWAARLRNLGYRSHIFSCLATGG